MILPLSSPKGDCQASTLPTEPHLQAPSNALIIHDLAKGEVIEPSAFLPPNLHRAISSLVLPTFLFLDSTQVLEEAVALKVTEKTLAQLGPSLFPWIWYQDHCIKTPAAPLSRPLCQQSGPEFWGWR